MKRIEPGQIVDFKGKRGVTVPDFMNCCGDWETPVVFYGDTGFEGIDTVLLSIIGPENPVADPHRCGAGKSANCCIFLILGPDGFRCGRHTAQRYDLQFQKRTMMAQREPTEPFPECQLSKK